MKDKVIAPVRLPKSTDIAARVMLRYFQGHIPYNTIYSIVATCSQELETILHECIQSGVIEKHSIKTAKIKKPGDRYEAIECPECDKPGIRRSYSYCPGCGLKIHWVD